MLPFFQTSEAAPVQDTNPLNRLRNRQRINVAARPKPAASAQVQVRRINPLLARRKTTAVPEATSSETPEEPVATEAPAAVEEEEESEAVTTSSTTEEPRGLNKLLAGRRRLIARHQAGSH